MLKRLRIIFAITLSLLVCSSCDDLRDNYDDCGIWLEFVFDHNMEYTDSFREQVGSVDVLIFDSEGTLVMIKAATADELEGRKRMFLGDSLPKGDYSVVTVGGLSEHFRFSHQDGSSFTRGESTIEDIRLAIDYVEATAEIRRQLPGLWYGQPVDISNRADLSTWQVPLIRQTNQFNITLRHTITTTHSGTSTRADSDPIYVAEIVTPEAGVYNHLNSPIDRTPLTYHAYDYESTIEELENKAGTQHDIISRMNTMRVFTNEDGYRLVIRNTETGKEVKSYNLLEMMVGSNPGSRADNGELLSAQEYLDRESNWNIVIIHERPATEGFIAVSISINGWIYWDTNMGI